MTSPLQNYANAYLVTTSKEAPAISNGRIISEDDKHYVVQCYLVRQQSTGTSTGGDYIPVQTTPGDKMPGSSGVVYLYAGYALRYGLLPNDYEQGDMIPSNTNWTIITSELPSWLVIGQECTHLQGREPAKYCKIERISGKYGNSAIDDIIISEVGGVPIIVRSGDLID